VEVDEDEDESDEEERIPLKPALNPDELFPEPNFDETRRKTVYMVPGAFPIVKIERLPTITADKIEKPEMQGWLTKQGGRIKTWKRRWFVLKDGCMYYFSNPTNALTKGAFYLQGYDIQLAQKQLKRDYAFRAYHPKARTYYFVASSTEEMEKWMKVMRLYSKL